tara:strand:- start:140 stop:403 length:264 start_codon:yes stop_codon:yes gene_type:complete
MVFRPRPPKRRPRPTPRPPVPKPGRRPGGSGPGPRGPYKPRPPGSPPTGGPRGPYKPRKPGKRPSIKDMQRSLKKLPSGKGILRKKR